MQPRWKMSWKPPGLATLCMVAGLAVFTSPERPSPQHVDERLRGTFRLISFRQTDVASGETHDVFGKAPREFISYGRDGRMLVVIVADARRKPADLVNMTAQERADLFNTMVAYGGTYTFDGKTVVHHVDIS